MFSQTRSNRESMYAEFEVHNHPISQDVTTYAIHRKQTPEIMQHIFSLLSSGHKDPVTSVMGALKALNVNNVIKKDIQNIQSTFFKSGTGKDMYSLVTFLESLGYKSIKEARLWPEAITVDAMYKTNAHKLFLCNVSSVKGINRLQTFAIAAAFINSETELAYTWIIVDER
ncbi:hypothetical protein EDC94DRAFT_665381 [Helicostylum pulchrum]|nr:hypothetical protein EDC94DRAFT_665381 [Helicostylum pulchrum]